MKCLKIAPAKPIVTGIIEFFDIPTQVPIIRLAIAKVVPREPFAQADIFSAASPNAVSVPAILKAEEKRRRKNTWIRSINSV